MNPAGVADPLWLGIALGAAGALVLGRAAQLALRHSRRGAGTLALLGAVGLGLAGALCATLSVGLQGYRALTREELAATVHIRPAGPQRFEAHFVFPDGSEARYDLTGDQFNVEARILKWQPWANLMGLHTAYRLDRVTGRYASLGDELTRERSVFALGDAQAPDLFAWRQRLAWLSPLLDAQYGSATFSGADREARYEVRVSTSGLLVRPAPDPGSLTPAT